MSDLLARIIEIRSTVRPRPTFSLECGKGETYRHAWPVLYAHSVYDRNSVLAGQPRRLWVAEAALPGVPGPGRLRGRGRA